MRTRLSIDGDDIELNQFVERFFANVVTGAISALKGVKSDWKIVELTVERE